MRPIHGNLKKAERYARYEMNALMLHIWSCSGFSNLASTQRVFWNRFRDAKRVAQAAANANQNELPTSPHSLAS